MQYLGLAYPLGLIICLSVLAYREVKRQKNLKNAISWLPDAAPARSRRRRA